MQPIDTHVSLHPAKVLYLQPAKDQSISWTTLPYPCSPVRDFTLSDYGTPMVSSFAGEAVDDCATFVAAFHRVESFT